MAAIRALALLSTAAALIVLTPRPAAACSCLGGVPLCESFWRSDAVFSGEVVEIEEGRPQKGAGAFLTTRRVRFDVDRVWRGDVPGSIDVTTGAGGGDCGYRFRKGRKYLVYASEDHGRLVTHICAPTKPLDRAAEDLAYLNSASAAPVNGRIYGAVRHAGDRAASRYIVVLNGSGQRQTMTNAAGEFEFREVAPGAYTVRVLPRESERTYGRADVNLPDPRACARRDFTIEPQR